MPQTAAGRALLASYGAFFAGSRGGMRLFELVNLAFTMTSGIVQGVASSADGYADVCAAAVWGPAVLAALTVLQLILCVALWPSNVPIDNMLCGVAGALAGVSQVLSASDDDTDAANGLNVTIVVVEWVGIVLGLVAWVLHYRRRRLVAVNVAVVPKNDTATTATRECPPKLAALIRSITDGGGRRVVHGDATQLRATVLGDAYVAHHGGLARLVEQITNMTRVMKIEAVQGSR